MVNPSLDARPVYTIDALDRIVFANPAWLAFVRKEGGVTAPLQNYLGRSVWTLFEGEHVRQLWEVLFRRVRAVGAAVFVPMRVDTPSERRLVDIELHPLADSSIRHVCERVWTQARPAVALLDPAWPRDERLLRCCAWCRRIQVRIGVWEEVEDATLSLLLEASGPLPALESSVCVTCKQSLLKTFPVRVA